MFADILSYVKDSLPEPSDVAELYKGDIVGYAEKRLGVTLTDDMRAFLLSVQNNTITVVQSGTSLGKTYSEAILTLYFFEVYQDSQIYLTAPPPVANLQHQLWAEIVGLIDRHQLNLKTSNLLIKGLHSKHFVRGMSIPTTGTSEDKIAKFSGKHAPVLIWGVDEGDAVPDEAYEGIDGCMSGGELVRLFISFNPKKRSGRVYDLINNGRANVVRMSAFTHPNVVTGVNGIPGAVTREYVIRKTHEWCEHIPEFNQMNETLPSGIFQLPHFLEGVQCLSEAGELLPPLRPGFYRIVDGQYAYKIIGVYPSDGSNQLIPQQYIDEAVSRWYSKYGDDTDVDINILKHVQGVGGLDVGDEGADPSCLVRKYGVIFPKPMYYYVEDAGDAGERAVMDCISNGLTVLNIDGIGVGAAAVHSARRVVRDEYDWGLKTKLVVKSVVVSESPRTSSKDGKFNKYRDELYWELRKTFLHKAPLLYPDPDVLKQLALVLYEEDASGRIRVSSKQYLKSKLGGKSPEALEGMMLTHARNLADFSRI